MTRFRHPTLSRVAVALVIMSGITVGCVTMTPSRGEPIAWETTATPWRDRTDSEFTVTLPPQGTAHQIWGTGIYTDDSSIGTAAVHSGLLTLDRGGTVTIRVLSGRSHYPASAQHGVTSAEWGEWDASFQFVVK